MDLIDPFPVATLIGLNVPPECVAGVQAMLDGLAEHLRILEGFALPADDAE